MCVCEREDACVRAHECVGARMYKGANEYAQQIVYNWFLMSWDKPLSLTHRWFNTRPIVLFLKSIGGNSHIETNAIDLVSWFAR